MTTRETLHKMVDLLPESEWEAARRVLEERLAEHDPVLRPNRSGYLFANGRQG